MCIPEIQIILMVLSLNETSLYNTVLRSIRLVFRFLGGI